MKAIYLKDFGDADQFELRNMPTPSLQDDHVLVQVKACAFNPIDYQMRKGLGESKLLKSQILGREFSGIVMEPGHSNFNKGDAVFAYSGSLGSNGSYAEYISVPAAILARKPVNVDFLQAAAIPMVSLTALQCFERMNIRPGDTVFIAGGAGGVGSVLIQLLLSAGVQNIVTTAGNSQSCTGLQTLGIPGKNIIDYRQPDLSSLILKANNGRFFDHCIDIVGGAMSDLCSFLLEIGGNYADIAFLTTPAAREVLFDKAATVYNIANYAFAAAVHTDSWSYYKEKLRFLADQLEAAKINAPSIMCVGDLSVSTVAQAHSILENNKAGGRKLVMKVS